MIYDASSNQELLTPKGHRSVNLSQTPSGLEYFLP
jgi:hypothetical protein